MKKRYVLLFALIISLIFFFPYVNDKLFLSHDTLFHISRIEGLAQAFKNFDFLPRIYPLKNDGFSYPSPLFYPDIFLSPFALLYLLNISLSDIYKLIIFIATFTSCITSYMLLKKLHSDKAGLIAMLLYTFSNYHITNVYVRGAMGEVFALIFFPLVLYGLYDLFYNNKSYKMLWLSLSCLCLSHIISFSFAIIVCLLFALINFKKILLDKILRLSILKTIAYVFLTTAFFTLPLLEIYFSDNFFMKLPNTNMARSSLSLNQYFSNITVNGLSYKDLDVVMLMNVGTLVTFTPLFYTKYKKDPFITSCLIFGYIFMLLPSEIFPWDKMTFLSFMQFPFRLSMLALVFLLVPASIVLSKLNFKILSLIIIFEAIFHLYPITNFKGTYITNKTRYENLLDSSIIDPYFAAFYVRVELAGADYLPVGTSDIRDFGKCIKDSTNTPLVCDFIRNYDKLIFSIKNDSEVTLPISYYKGYSLKDLNTNKNIDIYPSPNKFISSSLNKGTYMLWYKKTFLQKYSSYISLIFILYKILSSKICYNQLIKHRRPVC